MAATKRPAAALVSYNSSEEEDSDEGPSKSLLASEAKHPPKKRYHQSLAPHNTLLIFYVLEIRKLPPISSTIVPSGPVDNPSLHQGRIRTTPHVEGQFSAHVYVALGLKRGSPLYKLVHAILSDAKEAVPTLHEIWKPESDPSRQELHLSLSRPISLRAHQREDLKRAVKNIAKTHKA